MAPESDTMIFVNILVDAEQGKQEVKAFSAEVEKAEKKVTASVDKIDQSTRKVTSATKKMADGVKRDATVASDAVAAMARRNEEAASRIERSTIRIRSGAQTVFEAVSKVAPALATWGVAAYAVVQGVRFLTQTLGGLIEKADEFTSVGRGFETLSEKIGETSETMLKDFTPATQGLVNQLDLMKQANAAIILQLPVTAEKMSEMAGIAVRLGRAMGVEPNEALKTIILGIGRESNRLLDNIGILVDTHKAHEDYARSIGKTADMLTEVEKRQGFFNATMEAAHFRVKGLGEESFSATERWRQFKVAVDDTTGSVLSFINVNAGKFFTGMKSAVVDATDAILAVQGIEAKPVPVPFDEDPRKLKEVEERLKALFKAADPGGLNLSRGYDILSQNLDKLGVSALDTMAKADTLRGAIKELEAQAATQELQGNKTFVYYIRLEVEKLQRQLDSLLNKTKEVKDYYKETAGPLGSTFFEGKGKLPEADLSVAGPQPFDTGFGANLKEQQENAAKQLEGGQEQSLKTFLDGLFGTEESADNAEKIIQGFIRKAMGLKEEFFGMQTEMDRKKLSVDEEYYQQQLALLREEERAAVDAANAEFEAYALSANKQIKAKEDRDRAIQELDKAHQQKLSNISMGFEMKRQKFADMNAKAKMAMEAQIIGAIGDAVTAVFGKSKAGAIAGAIMNTAAAVMNALANIPYPANIAVAASAAATGVAQIAKIKSTTLNGGGGGAGSGVSYAGAVSTSGSGFSGAYSGTTPVVTGRGSRDSRATPTSTASSTAFERTGAPAPTNPTRPPGGSDRSTGNTDKTPPPTTTPARQFGNTPTGVQAPASAPALLSGQSSQSIAQTAATVQITQHVTIYANDAKSFDDMVMRDPAKRKTIWDANNLHGSRR